MATLKELSSGYRDAAAKLRIALEDAEDALDGLTGADYKTARYRVRSLRNALQQARDLRELCDRYYERAFHASPIYTNSELRARKRDATKE